MRNCEAAEQGEIRTPNVEVRVEAFPSSLGRSAFDVRRSAFAFLLFTLAGCCPPQPPPPKAAYLGPTEPMEIVTAEINANSARIGTLWTQLNFSADFVNPQTQQRTAVAGDGVLMFGRPRSLLINGDKDVAGQVLQVGSNDQEYWVKIRSSASSFDYWWGSYSNLGKAGKKRIPIRPDLVIEVLGISLYRSDFLISPVPVMRFDNDVDAYVFDLNEIDNDRWETREEIWYDRQSKLPIKVLLYGPDGRAVLKADLSLHTAVEVAGIPPERWPRIARHYDLLLPDTGSKVTFDLLNTPQLQHQTGHHPPVPNDDSFHRQEPDPEDKVYSIDADQQVS